MRVITPSLSATLQSTKGGDDELQIVPSGTRSRLKSIYAARNDLLPLVSNKVVLKFRDGTSSSAIMFEILLSVVFNSFLSVLNGTASDMVDLPGIGILFKDGMHVEVDYVDAADSSKYLITLIYTI